MSGRYIKSFLLKVTGERSNPGHLWLNAALSFVNLCRSVSVSGCVCVLSAYLCGLTLVENRLSRLILLPAPVDKVSGA